MIVLTIIVGLLCLLIGAYFPVRGAETALIETISNSDFPDEIKTAFLKIVIRCFHPYSSKIEEDEGSR